MNPDYAYTTAWRWAQKYEAADYGYAQGVDKALRWAVSEVQGILDSLPNVEVKRCEPNA